MGAGRVAFAEIALDNFIMYFIHQSASERTGRHAGHTLGATTLIELDCPGFFIAPQGIENAGFDAGRIIALQTGHRNIFIFGMRQRINTASTLFQILGMSEGTGQFAGATSGTERRIHDEAIFHPAISCA